MKSKYLSKRSTESSLVATQVAARARNQDRILGILLRGTTGLFGVMLVLLFVSYGVFGHSYVLGRILLCGGVLAFLWLLNRLRTRARAQLAGALLVTLYLVVAVGGMWYWGTNLAFPQLLISLVIVFSGILLGSRAVLYAAGFGVGGMLMVQLAILGGIDPYTGGAEFYKIGLGDALGYSLFFLTLASVVWLFCSQMERLLVQAYSAEAALEAERNSLAARLEEHTKKLKTAQLKEMQQLYRFTELGQLSTSLLHELANHLTVLTLDIEDLQKKQHSEAILSAKESINHLENLVENVRLQAQGDKHLRTFNAVTKIKRVISQLQQKASQSQVTIQLTTEGKVEAFNLYGDLTRFIQIITTLVSNAIEAAGDARSTKITINARIVRRKIEISIHDWGKGLSRMQQKKLFKPFVSSKPNGMGIGLFIAQQTAENHFKGKLVYDGTSDHTVFRLEVPRKM